MDNKIVAVVIIILLIVVGAAYIMGAQNFNTPAIAVNNTTNATQDINKAVHDSNKHENDTKQNTTPNVKISAAQAQQIAIGAAQELGGENDTAGTPKLYKWTVNKLHTWVWDVPLFDAKTKKSAGAMDVDAMTGEVIMNE